jgi:ribosomal-protein-alanine N-acetyltransferase
LLNPSSENQSEPGDSPPDIESRPDAVSPRQRLRSTTLPVLKSQHFTLRQLEPHDALSLATLLGTAKVQEFLPTTPKTPEAFLRYIRWARRQQRTGRHLAFGVVPDGLQSAVGVLQIWPIESQLWTAEWGFALGPPYWGTGLFLEAAEQFVDFVIHTLGVYRLEARSAAENARGNRALEKLGAVREGLLRQCFDCEGQRRDHWMWSIIKDDWSRRHADRKRCLERVAVALAPGATRVGVISASSAEQRLDAHVPAVYTSESYSPLRAVK